MASLSGPAPGRGGVIATETLDRGQTKQRVESLKNPEYAEILSGLDQTSRDRISETLSNACAEDVAQLKNFVAKGNVDPNILRQFADRNVPIDIMLKELAEQNA